MGRLLEVLGLKHIELENAPTSSDMAAVDPLLAGCSAWGGRQGVDPGFAQCLSCGPRRH